MHHSVWLLFILVSGIRGAYMPDPPQARYDPSKVLILFDATYTGDEDMDGVQDSLQLAEFYATARSIPKANLLPINYTKTGDFTFQIMKTDVLAPLTQYLDKVGPATIDIFAIMWPLPWAILDFGTKTGFDSIIMSPYEYLSGKYTIQTSYCSYNPKNPTFVPSLDGNYTLNRFSHSGNNQGVYLVSRIDGPAGLAQKLNLIANAIYADKYVNTDAFWGMSYIDSRGMFPPAETDLPLLGKEQNVIEGVTASYLGIDMNLAYGVFYVKNKTLPYKWENTESLIGMSNAVWLNDNSPAKSAPRTMFYWGWYSYNVYWNVFEWLPGAYACDFNSVSLGYDIRNHYYSVSGTQSLYHGASFTMGSVDEPYGDGVARPQIAPALLLLGFSWAEAATYSVPCFGWKSILIGDPLYQPFAEKSLVVDTTAPQPGPIDIQFNNVTGVTLVFSLQGIESAQITRKYGIVSVEENVVVSRYYMTHFREQFNNLGGSTTYKYQFDLVDPAGNQYASPIYTFTTRPQAPFLGKPQAVPGEIWFRSFDYGGESVATHDLVDIPYIRSGRPDTGIQVAYYDNNFVLETYHGEWIKWTINATITGTYSLELMYHATTDSKIMSLLFFVDGQQAMAPFLVVPAKGLGTYTPVGKLKLSAGIHVFKMMFNQTSGLQPYFMPQTAGEYYQMRFTLLSADLDKTPPSIKSIESTKTDKFFIEKVQFYDDYQVVRLDVIVNNVSAYKIYELSDDGVFPFYFERTKTFNVTVNAVNGAGLSSTWSKSFARGV